MFIDLDSRWQIFEASEGWWIFVIICKQSQKLMVNTEYTIYIFSFVSFIDDLQYIHIQEKNLVLIGKNTGESIFIAMLYQVSKKTMH